MRAYIKLWGQEYLIGDISWHEGISTVSFWDERGEYRTIFGTILPDRVQIDRDSGEHLRIISTDLEDMIVWKENKKMPLAEDI